MLHLFESELSGGHHYENVCMINQEDAALCTTEFYFYSIHTADPMLYIVGDGYMGLGLSDPGHTDGEHASEFNTLSQMKKHGMIDEMKFGLHVPMRNDTETVGQIRLGAWNEDLV